MTAERWPRGVELPPDPQYIDRAFSLSCDRVVVAEPSRGILTVYGVDGLPVAVFEDTPEMVQEQARIFVAEARAKGAA